MQKQKKVITIFLSPGGIGEIILQTPFYKIIKEHFPHSAITALVYSKLSIVLENNPNIDNICTYSSKSHLLRILMSLRPNHYDECYIFDKSWKSILLSKIFIKSKQLIGFKRTVIESLFLDQKIPYFAQKHESIYYLDMLGCNHTHTLKPEIYPVSKDFEIITKFKFNSENKKVALLAGGANNMAVGDEPFRRWPQERYKEIASKFINDGYEIILVGGTNDIKINNFIKDGFDINKIYDFTGKLSLHQSGIILSYASLIICHDSGLMHLASCFNRNILCLFGATSPKTLLPQVDNAQFIWADEAIYSNSIRLYGTKTVSIETKQKFFKKLTVAEVFAKACEMLSLIEIGKYK
jgi:lipopolysaccharide heptosyltransferase II